MAYIDLGGTHRARSISETLRLAQTLGKEIGVTRVADVTGLDVIGIPTAIAIRPNAKLLSVSQGKGMTLELAKVSALMESIEGYYAENIPLPALKGSYDHLSTIYAMPNPVTIGHSIFDLKPLQNRILHWCAGINLINNQPIYIPYEAISLNSTKITAANLLFGASSNGLASGNTRAEAVCHALCELIERDAYFKFNGLSRESQYKCLLDINSITSTLIQSLLNLLDKAGIHVQIWDITSDIGMPAFCCTLFDGDISRKTQIFSGQGCHFDKAVALCRAITEAAQVRLTFITGSRDDVFPSYYEKELMVNAGAMKQGNRQYHQIKQPAYSNDFEENIKLLTQKLAGRGFKTIALITHTPSSFPISVVQAVIPHLYGREDT